MNSYFLGLVKQTLANVILPNKHHNLGQFIDIHAFPNKL